MKTDLQEKAIQAEKYLTALEDRAQRLIDHDDIPAALELNPRILTARKDVHRMRARLASSWGGDLWAAAAEALVGALVVVRWDRKIATFGQASNEIPPVITLNITMAENSPGSLLHVFLHECGHLVDFSERDPKLVSKESREERANEWAEIWSFYADRNCMKYDLTGRSGLEIRLLAFINYSEQELLL